MARIRIFGMTITAEPVRELANGAWEMIAKQHTGRTSIGTKVVVHKNEIVEMAAAELPADDGAKAVEKAMAAERATLPAPAQVIADHQAAKAAQPAEAGVSVPSHPTAAPMPAPTNTRTTGHKTMQHLRDKLKAVSGATKEMSTDLEQRADAFLARKEEVKQRTEAAFKPHEAAFDAAIQGLDEIEAAGKLLSNGGPE